MSDPLDDELRRLLTFDALGGTPRVERFVGLVTAGAVDDARAELSALSHSEVVEVAVLVAGLRISYSTGRAEYSRLLGIVARELEILRDIALEHGVDAMCGAVAEMRKAADSLANPPE